MDARTGRVARVNAGAAHEAFAALPWGPASTIPGPVLILAPHPDDESLGTSGLIATLVAAGQPPFVMIMTDGAGSHPNSVAYPPARLRAVREAEAASACALLGLPQDRLDFMRLPDTAAPMAGPAFEVAVKQIAACARIIGARSVLASWAHDPHCDHLATHRMAAAVCRTVTLAHWAYPVWGWTLPANHALPPAAYAGFRLDITPYLPAKRAAIAAHRSQYAGLITDDPAGFVLPPRLLSIFDRPFETFIRLR